MDENHLIEYNLSTKKILIEKKTRKKQTWIK